MSTATVASHDKECIGGHATWLADLRILCVGSSTVLQIASGVLKDFGARVQYLTSPAEEDLLEATGSDIVLVDRIESASPVNGLAGNTEEYVRFVERTNTAVWVTASAYGLQTSRADAVGSELTVLASGGILGHSRDADGVPTLPAGSIALKLVGITMAMSALHGLHKFRERTSPVHVDLSAQAAVISTGLCLEMAHALARCANEGGSSRYGAPTGFFACRDGAICIVVLEQHQWAALRTCLAPALDDIPTLEDARRRAGEVNDAVASWVATRSTVECERILQRAGVPCTAVNPVGTFLQRAQEAGRSLSLESDSPTLPAVVREGQAGDDAGVEEGAILLRSLRVLDAGHVLAVPLATAWLGAMGAQVTKLEDPDRLDVYRRRGPFVPGGSGPNRSAYFNQVNYCKQSLDVRVDSSGSSLDTAPYHVIVHNLSPRRAAAVGVGGADALATAGPRLSIASSGFGGTGEWAGYRAYGHNIHAFGGLVAATRDAEGNMADVGTPWADPLTGAVVATWVLAWSLAGRRNRNTAVDLSMAEIMAAQLRDLMGVDPEDYYRPSGIGGDFFLRSERGGGMVAVTLRSRGEVARFEELTGVTFSPPASRGGLVAEEVLGSLRGLDALHLADKLRTAGLAAAAVQTARDLAADEFIRSTGLFQQVQSKALGPYDVTGLPWAMVGEARAPLTAAPERP
ncbi:CoA transferase [Streptomyces sp. NPDC001393]